MSKRFIYILVIELLLSTPIHALSEVEIRITSPEIKSAGMNPSQERYAVSIQAFNLYDQVMQKSLSGIIPLPKKQFYCSAVVGTDKTTIYYYEFRDHGDAAFALDFIRPFIWGSGGPNSHHPERIYNFDNYVIILSSMKKNKLDLLLQEKIMTLPVPHSLFLSLHKRLKCGTSPFDSPCGVLKAFMDVKFLPIDACTPSFGQSWEINDNGAVTKAFIEVLELRKTEKGMRGFWFPIHPDNKNEKKQLDEIIQKQKSGGSAAFDNDLSSFLNEKFAGDSQGLKQLSPVISFLKQKGNTAQLQKVKDGFILIVTNEHWTGKASPFIIAFFWNKR